MKIKGRGIYKRRHRKSFSDSRARPDKNGRAFLFGLNKKLKMKLIIVAMSIKIFINLLEKNKKEGSFQKSNKI